MAPIRSGGCSGAAFARTDSPSGRGRLTSIPGSRRRRFNRSWTTSPRGVASARPDDSARSIAARSAVSAESPESTPATFTTRRSLFPPNTREAQFDEKWAFVAKKEKNCDPDDPADDRKGDAWDHVAIDAESRLVISVVPGERTAENVAAVGEGFKRRTGGRGLDLKTTHRYPAYGGGILAPYGATGTPPRAGQRGPPAGPH